MNAIDKPANLFVPGMPVPLQVDEQVAQLKKTLLKDIQRSAYVYRVDCGGCNGCEIEIFAAITPIFDAERSMRIPALRAFNAAPDPKIVVSYGACGCSGGIFHDLYCVWGGTDKIVPVDVYIPGCPPRPEAIIYGVVQLLESLKNKTPIQEKQEPVNDAMTGKEAA